MQKVFLGLACLALAHAGCEAVLSTYMQNFDDSVLPETDDVLECIGTTLKGANGVSEFSYGFLVGLQKNSSQPSDCIEQWGPVKEQFSKFASDFAHIHQDFNNLWNGISQMRIYSDLLNAEVDTCKFPELLRTVTTLSYPENWAQYAVKYFAGYAKYNSILQNVGKSLGDGNFLDAGMGVGSLFSDLTGFYL